MGIVESEADAIAWVHQMAKTPTPGDHEVAEPHPYCLGDDPCCCVQLIAAEQTARADEREKAAGRADAVRITTTWEGDLIDESVGELVDRILAAIRQASDNAATTGDTDD